MTEKEADLQNLADAEKFLEEGRKCFSEKEYDLALNLFNKAIESREKAGDAEYILDSCCYELSEYYTIRGDCYIKKGDHNSSSVDHMKAIELIRNSVMKAFQNLKKNRNNDTHCSNDGQM